MSSRDTTKLAVLIALDRLPSDTSSSGAEIMFAVIFEVNPKPEQWDAYLGYAKLLRPELEQIDGFIDNERFSSLRREGWLLSLTIWRDEKAVIRWRTRARHHEVQQ